MAEAVLMCTHNKCFEQKKRKIQIFFQLKFFNFYRFRKFYVLHGHFFRNGLQNSKTHVHY